jgi:hypothetical protein
MNRGWIDGFHTGIDINEEDLFEGCIYHNAKLAD